MDKDLNKAVAEQKDYELAFLVENENSAQEIPKFLGQHNVQVRSEGTLKKIKLAYKIKGLTQACFGFFHLLALPEDIKLLEQNLKTNSIVVRFLVTRLAPTPASRSADAASRYRVKAVVARRPAAPPEVRPQKALSNEALEKKIEEILK